MRQSGYPGTRRPHDLAEARCCYFGARGAGHRHRSGRRGPGGAALPHLHGRRRARYLGGRAAAPVHPHGGLAPGADRRRDLPSPYGPGSFAGRRCRLRSNPRVAGAGRSGLPHHLRRELSAAAVQHSGAPSRARRLDGHRGVRADTGTAGARPGPPGAHHRGAGGGAGRGTAAPLPPPRRASRRRVGRSPGRGARDREAHARPSRARDAGISLGTGSSLVTFIDRAVVHVVAGTGGSGSSSFARFKYVPKGGPDGGDGGHGGSIYVKGDANLSTLLDYRYRTSWKADRGQHGKGKTMTGASGDDLYLPVPPGTEIRDLGSGELLGEILGDGQELLVAKGGRGGRGNARFATSTHQAPREWEPGQEGQDRQIELVLKLIADVGLVGEPNAGKSSLLAAISAARPKIADYPFTTLEPNLGVVGLSGSRSFVVADIPGIIEGAHEGKGLGLKFLQHVERTRVLAFLVPIDSADPPHAYDQLRREAVLYSETLSRAPHQVLISKPDLLPPGAPVPAVHAPDAAGVLAISSGAGTGLEELKEFLWRFVQAARADEESA